MTASTPKLIFDDGGYKISIGKKIGSGGEGDVYEILSHNQEFVAKIYHKPLDKEKQQKLKLMVQGCNDDLKRISAWPDKLIYNGQNGPICGFLMPKISDYEPIHKLYGPAHRKQLFPNADWKFLIRASKNLAAAFSVMHNYGYVIGDVNEGNILVNKQALVKLIDCDSFQVRDQNNKIYYCEVGVAQFTPPEIQNSKNFKIPRSPNYDNFGLSILIFQLLFLARHPFAGVYHGKGDMPIEKAIAEYRFAFGKTAHLKSISPPPNSVDLSIIPDEVSNLFEQAFTEKGVQQPYRPSANSWWKALDSLEKQLKTCKLEAIHKYYSALTFCPWCKLEAISGILLFLGFDITTKFDLGIEWQRVHAIKSPGPLPNITPKNYHYKPEPISKEIETANLKKKIRRIIAIIIGIGGVLINIWLIIPSIIIALLLFLYQGKEKDELIKRQKKFVDIRNRWIELNKKWKKEASDEEYKIQYNRLAVLKRNYESLEKEYANDKISLQNAVRTRQFNKYLENCFIDSYNIPRIGPNRKATLRSFGIETAADVVDYKIMRIPGFGNALTNELLSWRRQMENNFHFDPSKGVDKSDIQMLIHKFQPKMRPIEREFRSGIENLNDVQGKIFKNRMALQPIVEECAKELAQATSDLEPFKIYGLF
jgi:DNA-binding helix-hairpin-helix protein with protein kinase domain